MGVGNIGCVMAAFTTTTSTRHSLMRSLYSLSHPRRSSRSPRATPSATRDTSSERLVSRSVHMPTRAEILETLAASQTQVLAFFHGLSLHDLERPATPSD